MPVGQVIATTFILLLHVGSHRSGFGSPIRPQRPGTEDAELIAIRLKANDLFIKGDGRQAQSLYETGLKEAYARGAQWSASRFLNNIAACHLAAFEYREAMRALLESRRLSTLTRDYSTASATSLNLSSLYLQLGETGMAAEAAERAVAVKYPFPEWRTQWRTQYLMQMANIKSQLGEYGEALRYYGQGLDSAIVSGNRPLEARFWSNIGLAFLASGDLERAESAIFQGYRIRLLTKDKDLPLSYPHIGRILLERGRPREARHWFNLAIANSQRLVATDPPWVSLYRRSMANAALGSNKSAYEDARRALESMKKWRSGIVPADRLRVTSEARAQDAYGAVVDSAGRLYLETGDPNLAWTAFQAVEDSRAWSLRESLQSARRSALLPPEYYETLSRLRVQEALALSGGGKSKTYEGLSSRLAEIESSSGVQGPAGDSSPAVKLAAIRAKLASGEALFSFHLGASSSWLWVVTRDTFRLLRLPGQAEIARRTGEFRKALEEGGDPERHAGESAFRMLFGTAPAEALRKPHWRLALDQDLFDLPFAALTEPGTARFLVEDHSLQVMPSVPIWLETAELLAPGPARLLGISDPIYNQSDPRLPRKSWFGSWRLAKPTAADLPRLVGGATELEGCARALGNPGGTTILTGAAANEDGVREGLRADPDVVHFAAHVTPSVSRPDQGMIALSLRPAGGPGLLSMEDIAALRINTRLVVMNGCASGAGKIVPGAGLLGLTRAWLRAGARNVAATRWPIPDDNGEMFEAFYRQVKVQNENSVNGETRCWSSMAMQQAQLKCLRSSGWRARPNYWAAFFTVGRE